jgi:hypothetical protein
MPIRFVLLLIFPVLAHTQTFTKDRFRASQKAIVWTETVEIKDMDTPIIVQSMSEHLKSKMGVHFDSTQQQGILTGWLIKPPSSSVAKARFRVDFLYESYIVTVSSIIETQGTQETPIEQALLKNDGSFIETFPERIDKLDGALASLFTISH